MELRLRCGKLNTIMQYLNATNIRAINTDIDGCQHPQSRTKYNPTPKADTNWMQWGELQQYNRVVRTALWHKQATETTIQIHAARAEMWQVAYRSWDRSVDWDAHSNYVVVVFHNVANVIKEQIWFCLSSSWVNKVKCIRCSEM